MGRKESGATPSALELSTRPRLAASKMFPMNWLIGKHEQHWAELDNPKRSVQPWRFWHLGTPPTSPDPLSWWTVAGLPLTGTHGWDRGSSAISLRTMQPEFPVSVTRQNPGFSLSHSSPGFF